MHLRTDMGRAKGLDDGSWSEAQIPLPWAGSCV